MVKAPILFVPVGNDGAAPLDFYLALASTYDAELHVTDGLYYNQYNDLSPYEDVRVLTHDHEPPSLTLLALQEGKNVVYKGRVNTFDREKSCALRWLKLVVPKCYSCA